jgi:7-keto-8-aminopelargonate synthetase-like enzyme
VTLEHFADDPRVVVVLSLNKAFAAAGGALCLPSEALKLKIRRVGGTMVFSGPIQPPMLGAAVGSAVLHLSEELPQLQRELQERIEHAQRSLACHDLAMASPARSPIFQLYTDSPRMTFGVVRRLRSLGHYSCAVSFPAVPLNRPGIRFTICRHNELEDIDSFVAALAQSVGETTEELRRAVSRELVPALIPED